MLYLRNTNQLQSLSQQVNRGPADTPPVPPTPVTSSYFDGLGRQAYSAYIDPFTNPNGYATGSTTGSLVADSGSLQAIFASGSANISNQWLGYFKASTNETYSFFLENDDNAVLWLGNAATASVLTTGSAVLKSVTGRPGNTGSISLTSGSYYPMRLQYADGAGDRYFTSSFSTPTITKTTDYTNYTFCNTSSLGF
jgi:hypothetical protein